MRNSVLDYIVSFRAARAICDPVSKMKQNKEYLS